MLLGLGTRCLGDSVIKVYQTLTGEEGDCWPACLASLLAVPLESIPNFCTVYGKRWFEESCLWLAKNHNMGILEVASVSDLQVDGNALVIGVGESTRARFHAVIFCINKNGSSLAHDPYEKGLGIIEIKYLYILTPFKEE